MKSILRLIFIVFFTVWLMPAQAILHIELTQGVNKALPIAIVPFSGQSVLAAGSQTVTDIVENDLTNSGQFRCIDSQDAAQKMTAPINYNFWRNLGVNDVIFGHVSSVLGRYHVELKLVDVYTKATLVDQTFNVGKDQLRALAHAISDSVYQKLTGIQGVFSTKLAYILVNKGANGKRAYRLEVSDADGFNQRPLLVSPMPLMSPAWSVDAKHLAYVSFEHHRATIYLQDIATGERHVVSSAPGINGAPAFSPDGQYMALVLTKTGYPKIYLKNLATGELTQLTHGYSIDTEPNYAPDGQSILFTSNRGGGPQIYRYDVNTKAVTRLTFSGNYNARARYSPDGKSFIMLHRDQGIFGIARQNIATGKVAVLTRANADESPSLAPNGQMIIYATEFSKRGVLAMVSTDGQVALRLPAREGSVQEPAWSPFLSTHQLSKGKTG